MPLSFRTFIGSLAILYWILWFAWVFTGFTAKELRGSHSMLLATMALIPCLGLSAFALVDTVPWFNPSGPHSLRRALRRERRKHGQPSTKPLFIAFLFWITMVAVAFLVLFYGDIGKYGQMGDSFNILTCLFLAIGFHFTIRQIHSEQEAGAQEKRRHRELVDAQLRVANIEYGKILIYQEEAALKLSQTYSDQLGSCLFAMNHEKPLFPRFGIHTHPTATADSEIRQIRQPSFLKDMLFWVSHVLKHQDDETKDLYRNAIVAFDAHITLCKSLAETSGFLEDERDHTPAVKHLEYIMHLLRMSYSHHREVIRTILNEMASGNMLHPE